MWLYSLGVCVLGGGGGGVEVGLFVSLVILLLKVVVLFGTVLLFYSRALRPPSKKPLMWGKAVKCMCKKKIMHMWLVIKGGCC